MLAGLLGACNRAGPLRIWLLLTLPMCKGMRTICHKTCTGCRKLAWCCVSPTEVAGHEVGPYVALTIASSYGDAGKVSLVARGGD